MRRFVAITALKDLQRMRRDPLGLILSVGIPLIIGSLIIMASGGRGGTTPRVHLLLADRDESFVSGFLAGSFGQGPMAEMVQLERVELEEGRKRIGDGEASALLIIPEGFGEAVFREEPVTLELITNPAQRILPGIAKEMLSVFVDATFYVHRLIGDDLRGFAGGPPEGANTFPDSRISDFSTRVNGLVDRVSAYLTPPVIQIETPPDEPQETTSESGLGLAFLPGILLMSLLFMAQGLSGDFWQEREQKTLRRVAVSPGDMAHYLLGKLLAGAVVMAAISLIAIAVGCAYFRLDPARMPLALLWSVFTGVLLILMLTVIQLYVSSQRAGGIVTSALVFPLMMIGGSFFPFEIMPAWMAAVGKRTPNGWALEQLKNILKGEVEAGSLAVAVAALFAFAALFFWVSARRLRSGFAQG